MTDLIIAELIIIGIFIFCGLLVYVITLIKSRREINRYKKYIYEELSERLKNNKTGKL